LIVDDPDSAGWALDQIVRGAANYSKSYNNAGPSAPSGYGDKYTQAELNDFLNAKPIEVIDPMTVAIHLGYPSGSFLSIMTYEEAMIDSPSAIIAHWTAPTDGRPYLPGITPGDYHGTFNPWPEDHPVGTGPYILQSWDKATQTQVLVRNEHYWGGPYNRGIAPVKNIVIKYVSDPNTRLLDITGGQTDIVSVPVSDPTIFGYANKTTWLNEGKLVSLYPDIQIYPQCPPETPIAGKCTWPLLGTAYLGLNQLIYGINGEPQAFQPFSDIRIRKAFTLAFDRDTFVREGLEGLGLPATQILPPTMFGYDTSIQETPYDPNTAKLLLIDAGTHPLTPANAFSPQNPQTVQLPYALESVPYETAVTVLANDINSLASDTGLYVQAIGMTGAQISPASHKGQLVYTVDWEVDYPDPDDFIVPFSIGEGGSISHGVSYANPNVTNLVNEETHTTDRAQRLQLISQIEHMVNNDYAYLWLFYEDEFSVSRTYLHERPNATLASHI
jgi:peptide/nickel transport system substrate-binding protein